MPPRPGHGAGARLRCDGCGAQQWRWHSCRDRHCPQRQTRQREAWRAARLVELLDVPYGRVYGTLMQCTAATLAEFAANARWLGGIGAFTLVLHTWTQDLRRHLHVHALMACGALQLAQADAGDGADRWLQPKRSRNFLFPVQALRRHDWVVYAKTPLAGPAAVLDYLSRYTHRTAIGNERLLAIGGNEVRLRVRADDTGGKRVIAMPGEQFIGRLLQHVLPSGF